MVLGVVSNEGHVIPPHFFSQRLRANSAAYIEPGQDFSAPHKAKLTQEWIAENFHDHRTSDI